jgi:hypothetical protein
VLLILDILKNATDTMRCQSLLVLASLLVTGALSVPLPGVDSTVGQVGQDSTVGQVGQTRRGMSVLISKHSDTKYISCR